MFINSMTVIVLLVKIVSSLTLAFLGCSIMNEANVQFFKFFQNERIESDNNSAKSFYIIEKRRRFINPRRNRVPNIIRTNFITIEKRINR